MRAWLVCVVGACAVATACGDDGGGSRNTGNQAGESNGGVPDDTAGSSSQAGGKAGTAGATSGGADTQAGAGSSEGGEPASAGSGSSGAPSGGAGGAPSEPVAEPDPRCATAEAAELAGSGSLEDPFLLCLPSQFQAIDTVKYPLSAAFALGQDIDVSQLTPPLLGGGDGKLSGSLDGRRHALSGLTLPLFNSIEVDASVKDLQLSGTLTGQSQHGLLAASSAGKLEGLLVSGSFALADHAGALVGRNAAGGTIVHCASSGTISASFNHVGGLVGENDGTITESFSTVDIKGVNRVGGLVGNLTMPGVIQRSFSTGKVTGDYSVGGLVGTLFSGEIHDSYARSPLVTGPQAGGLIGHIYGTATLVHSYTTSPVTGQDAHGFVGFVQDMPQPPLITITSCYFNDATADTLGTGLPLADLKKQASFVGWDFATVWQMKLALSPYPSLRFE